MENTLAIIKPDGVRRKLVGTIISRLEEKFLIRELRLKRLSRLEAEGFYVEHKEKPFFKDLIDYMTSGPVVLLVLASEGAIFKYRELMGATNPEKAAAGTLRREFALNLRENTVPRIRFPGGGPKGSEVLFWVMVNL